MMKLSNAKFARAEYFAHRDVSTLQPYGDDCLSQQVPT